MSVRNRLAKLEQTLTPVQCAHPWHDPDPLEVRQVDYRVAVVPLAPDYVPPAEAPAPDRCPACGAEAEVVEVRAVDMRREQMAGLSMRLTPKGAPA